jgi:uncharacterized protein YbjT (DUF2867 family)
VLGYNAGVQKILIVGSGDVARRILSQLAPRARIYALLRDASRAAQWRAAGATPVLADLDDRSSLARLAGLADCVLHLAPPPGSGKRDTRTRNLLAALSKGKSLPRSPQTRNTRSASTRRPARELSGLRRRVSSMPAPPQSP